MSEAVGTWPRMTGRQIHLVLENDADQASLLDPLADPPHGKYRPNGTTMITTPSMCC